MLNDDKNPIPVDQKLADNDQAIDPSNHPVESIAVTLGNPLQTDSRNTKKPTEIPSVSTAWAAAGFPDS